MKEETRAQKNFVQAAYHELRNSKPYRSSAKKPDEVKAAERVVARWEAANDRAYRRFVKKFDERLRPISENIAFGNYKLALGLIKRFKMPKGY